LENILSLNFEQFFPEEKTTVLINVKENKIEIVGIDKRKQLIQNDQNYKVIPNDIFIFKKQDGPLTLFKLNDLEAFEVNADSSKKVDGISATPATSTTPTTSVSLNPTH
jgi:hypothetical protein